MSKELNALKRLMSSICNKCNGEVCRTKNKGACKIFQNYKVIETALKNYEEPTNEIVILCGRTHGRTQALIDTICKNYKEVKITNLEDEKKIKAFDIIKDFIHLDFEYGNLQTPHYRISASGKLYIDQEVFDLLKEVLKWE